LEILARQYAANCKDADIVPFIDAKRGAVYAAFYSIRNGQIEAKKEPFLSTFNALLESIPKGGVLFGPDMDRFTVFVDGKQGILAPKENVYPQAETLATLTDEKIAKKIVQKTLEPIYIHDVILGQ
jgi:tRNA A37 threonylcarbamoyladenosine modification protein TsaB